MAGHGLQSLAELAKHDALPPSLNSFIDTKLFTYLRAYVQEPSALLTALRRANALITGSIVLVIAFGNIAWIPGDLDILVEYAGLAIIVSFFEDSGYTVCEAMVSHETEV